jgi:hypothetical protein
VRERERERERESEREREKSERKRETEGDVSHVALLAIKYVIGLSRSSTQKMTLMG